MLSRKIGVTIVLILLASVGWAATNTQTLHDAPKKDFKSITKAKRASFEVLTKNETYYRQKDFMAGPLSDDINAVAKRLAKQLQLSKKQTYVPNEIIVKFGEAAAKKIDYQLSNRISTKDLKVSASIDKLKEVHGVNDIEPVFKDFKANQMKLAQIQTKSVSQLTKEERQILRRISRIPHGAKIPALDRIYRLKVNLKQGQSIEDAVKSFSKDPNVEYAQLNHINSFCNTPNDPYFSVQWALNNTGQKYPVPGNKSAAGKNNADIDAPEAWDIYQGNSDVVVAVIDSGADYKHEDLQGNMWTDVNGNHGYNYVNNNNDPMDDCGHGTHCAGIIAAMGNNGLDISGVCWTAKIMALKFLDSAGNGDDAGAIAAIEYAADNGADVLSNSWGPSGRNPSNPALEDVVNYAYFLGCVVVFAAGNSSDDVAYYSPANDANVISVVATDSGDRIASFSNYGNLAAIAAPGVDILSLHAAGTDLYKDGLHYYPNGDPNAKMYISSGTSMACPQVAGACALLLSYNPALSNEEVRRILVNNADIIFDPNDHICSSNGRLNIGAALAQTPQSAKGHFFIDNTYTCSDTIHIRLEDYDIRGNTNVVVNISTSSGDSEIVTLNNALRGNKSIGVFTGDISTVSGETIVNDGILEVHHGDIITFVYEDADNGTGSPSTVTGTAIVDCEGPVVSNFAVDASLTQSIITFETNEPAQVTVKCGLACSSPNEIEVSDSSFATNHRIKLKHLSPSTNYFISVECNDILGNHSVNDNNGQCYTFTTIVGKTNINVPGDFNTIQDAIDHSWDGGTIWLADGTYSGAGNYNLNFNDISVTVKSASGPANCIIDCQNKGRGFIFQTGEDVNAVIEGLTIAHGAALTNLSNWWEGGGAIYCLNGGSTIIRNCRIIQNAAMGAYGGALFCDGGSTMIKDCIISENSAVSGGALTCSPVTGDTNVVLTNCVINKNTAEGAGSGGGIYSAATLALNGCQITDNSAISWFEKSGGGGVCALGIVNINDCIISGNSAQYGGGIAIGGVDTTSVVSNSSISTNIAESGGGVYLVNAANLAMKNCVVKNSSAESSAGIYVNNQASLFLTNCTVTNNHATEEGAGITAYYGSYANISNSIIWGNSTDDGLGEQISLPWFYIRTPLSTAEVVYSDVEGGQAGVYDPCSGLAWDQGNLNINPGFALEDDYHLMNGSPCIDAGTNDPCGGLPASDYDGNPRPLNNVADIGAFEFNSVSPSIAISPDLLQFSCDQNGLPPVAQTISIRNCGSGTLIWQISKDCNWLTVDANSGSSAGGVNSVNVSINNAGLSTGSYECKIIISAEKAANNPRTIRVKLRVRGIIHIPSQCGTIQEGINAAQNGDVVEVADGIYTGPGNRDMKFRGKAIRVKSTNGPANCVIDCQGNSQDPHRGFNFLYNEGPDSIVEGLTIRNGYTTWNDYPEEDFLITPSGGAIDCFGSHPVIINCIISNNQTDWYGGGISFNWSFTDTFPEHTAIVENCVIVDNSTVVPVDTGGAGIFVGDDVFIRNCDIAKNITATRGGGVFFSATGYQTDLQFVNNIVWANTAVEQADQIAVGEDCNSLSSVNISSCDVQSGLNGIYIGSPGHLTWGQGNIGADPCFIDFDTNDFHLRSSSPAIDSGTPVAYISPYDIEGNNRVIDGDYDGLDEPDMGAYEYVPPPCPYPVIAISNYNITFIAYQGGINPDPQMLLIHNGGAGSIKWEMTGGCPWLSVTPTTGDSLSGTTAVTLRVDISGLSRGTYTCHLNIIDANAVNSPRTFNVTLKVFIKGQLYVPSEYNKIQDAINSSSNGDTIIVSPGLYHENIKMLGKNIILRSSDPNDSNTISSTVIDGDALGTVVTLKGTENNCQIQGLTIQGGHDPVKGGGIEASGSKASIISCILSDNYSESSGGAINNSNGLIDRCIINGNTAEINGGGAANCTGVIRNSLIVNNRSASGGGVSSSDANIINCTISANTAEKGGGLANCGGYVVNCIIWNNTSDQLFKAVFPSFSCIEGGSAGTGNIDYYPEFIDPSKGNYQLQPWSVCVDSGTNQGFNLGAVDLTGNPRIIDGDRDGVATVDMGCYESLQIDAPAFKLSAWQIEFSDSYVLSIRNIGQKKMQWSAFVDCNWLTISPDHGTLGSKTVDLELKPNKEILSWGTYKCTLTISSADALNSPRIVPIICHVTAKAIHISPGNSTIQDAVNNIAENGIIVLADGTYTGQGISDIEWGTKSFTLRSENGPNNCVINVNATEFNQKRAFIFKDNNSSGSILEGVTIKNAYSSEGGSAIYCENSNPTIKNCIFTANTVDNNNGAAILNYLAGSTIIDCIFKNNSANNGGAISNEESNVKIVNCTLNDNIANVGGAVYNESSVCELTDCIFSDNSAVNGGAIYNYSSDINIGSCGFSYNNARAQIFNNGGGAIYNYSSSPTIEDCNFTGNYANWDGGAILNMLSSSPIVTNCVFYGNQALGNDGGALFNLIESNSIITRCSFINNRAKSWGGAMRNHDSSPIISNCLIADSWAGDNGGAIFNYDGSSPQLTNCTFAGNSANGNDGESLYNLYQCSPTAYSCIFWDGFGGTEIECNQAEIFVFYSDIKGCYNGQTNICADPLFVDPCNPDLNTRNYRLQADSPCINTGDPNHIAESNETDLDGQPRIIGSRIDMGAYEFGNSVPVANAGDNRIVNAYIDNNAEVNLDGSGSYSPQGMPLTYLWSWVINGNTYEANGVNPKIELPVGQYTIVLVVNDGQENSEPNRVVITVVRPIKGMLKITPQIIQRQREQRRIMAILWLPAGITKDQMDQKNKLLLYPGEVESLREFIPSYYANGARSVCIFAFFDLDEIVKAVDKNGPVRISVVGQFKTDQYFYGSDIIKVIGKTKGL